ncbi:MAG: arylsulfatase [Bacteroidota bacterium]
MLTRYFAFISLLFLLSCAQPTQESEPVIDRPNVILVITDDQGYGDLGFHGNSLIQTPRIDAFAQQSIRFDNFHVSPVCAPTRASLLTGRYSLRTGIRDTYNGGAIMAPGEVTVAEVLGDAGYSTGIFGKWHLGDNYPSRPMDQGFEESLIHLAGGMGQPGDVTNFFAGTDSSYFDPILWHNGATEQYEGYCSDVFTDQAVEFIEQNAEKPFFCYLAYNAPHTPLQVPQAYYDMYADVDPTTATEQPIRHTMTEKDKEDARRVYGMVSNIDWNFGKVLDKLDELDITDKTIVIFMTDNGPQQRRYNDYMNGRKGSVYRGGTRVPFFFRYPSKFPEQAQIDAITAHLDVLPTLTELCRATLPNDRSIDGQSMIPLLNGDEADWADRSLFFYWTRRYPELYHNIALQKGAHKLVGHTDYNAQLSDFELFNVQEDPSELENLVANNKEMATELKGELDRIYSELVNSPNLVTPPRIAVGSEYENPTVLNRNDAGGERGLWTQEEVHGMWKVAIAAGQYNVKFKFIQPIEGGGKMYLETGTIVHQAMQSEGGDVIVMNNVNLPNIECNLIPFYAYQGKRIFPFSVEMERIAP